MHRRQQLAWACTDRDSERERPEGPVMYVRGVAHIRASHGTAHDHDLQAAAGMGIHKVLTAYCIALEGRP